MPDDAEFASAYRGRRVCVTGGAGFIGSHLAEALVVHGAKVRIIDDLSNGLQSNLDGVADRIHFVRGSILDETALREATEGAELIFHQAAVASVPRSVKEPALYAQVNAMGTLRVLEAARAAGAGRLIYAASSSAYGDQADAGGPRVESAPASPQSPYAAAKCAGEHLLRAYAHCFGLSCLSLRYFNIFGPRQRPDSPYAAVIPLFIKALREGRAPVIYGDGRQTRDFTYVANAVHANLLAGAADADLRGDVVNIACGRSASVLDLLEGIARLLGVEPRCEFAAERTGEVTHSLANIDAARRLIRYEPIVHFQEGLKRTVDFCRDAFREG
ncbi:MAG: NAD-dependent epimerase/dehydratase family protein [Planctomycetota bacterium]|nr:NAD-dependent epimerase/dehydratase family protein [Planctomycetota bacterium]